MIVEFVRTTENLADGFAKDLAGVLFEKFVQQLSMLREASASESIDFVAEISRA